MPYFLYDSGVLYSGFYNFRTESKTSRIFQQPLFLGNGGSSGWHPLFRKIKFQISGMLPILLRLFQRLCV